MKIIFAIDGLQKGGAQRVFSNLIEYMSKQNNEIYLILLNKTKIEYQINKKVKIFFIDKKERSKNKILRVIKLFQYHSKFRQISKKLNPDIILSFLPRMNFVSLWGNNGKYPIIVSSRNDHSIEFPSSFHIALMKWLYPKTTGFIFQTYEQKEYFDSINIKKPYKIIPNPINEDFIVKPYEGKREKIIVNVGRLTTQKNQELIIKAFAEIKDFIPEYKLIIYGEGKLRKKLEDLIEQLQLKDRIYLPGVVDDLKEKIYKCSLFILSSNYEGMPNALMEAMAMGIPVISTDCPCGGPKSLIKNGKNGILIPVNDKEKLKIAILELLNDKVLCDSISKNATKIQNDLNSTKICKIYYDFMNTMAR